MVYQEHVLKLNLSGTKISDPENVAEWRLKTIVVFGTLTGPMKVQVSTKMGMLNVVNNVVTPLWTDAKSLNITAPGAYQLPETAAQVRVDLTGMAGGDVPIVHVCGVL